MGKQNKSGMEREDEKKAKEWKRKIVRKEEKGGEQNEEEERKTEESDGMKDMLQKLSQNLSVPSLRISSFI